ncbi:MurR/RpiR family transcriptional regulator [Peribacillus simplex]|uniref:MurR/RpiR family transcriptional regulator n=1 Tax=Bacillaceae TaxID=186817 RepID=UPI000660E75D|nr:MULTISPECIES: MurR/RpiR family transcriptional regulator [Bacillaceae]MCP1092265.1 MurR/RpiR family transcriptional regulator [Bacillaceae bacterium OS4b]MBD8590005.1 MurR/RpiR family transcriptional regulator [Peribacillus simplex]MCF7624400.1 MurR/RpiR family transcriptional regulator [Peribacillus frigoritolerans]MEA3575931.1 MurR/RpiR family transcriptional regulator [Peribacillus frigoritolerans]PRA81666.1 MurR/RpiR family transcriptional regulator [Peribacillus simplex]
MEYLAENLIYGIECSMDKFTKTEEELAHYILQRPEEVSQLTISQIAKKLHISPATITRFCQKLAFSGFNEFRHELKRFVDLRNTPKNMKNIKQVDYFAKLYQDHLGIIDNTFHITTYDNIQKAVSFLTKANKIHVYGIGSSGIAAQEFKSKFFRIGLTVEAITDPHQSMMDAALSNENSVVIGISISGTTKEVISAVKIAKKQGACILVFTGDKNSDLSQLGDLTLVVTSKNSMHMGQNISPLLPLLLLFDLLYTELVAKDYKNRISIREKTLKVLTEND